MNSLACAFYQVLRKSCVFFHNRVLCPHQTNEPKSLWKTMNCSEWIVIMKWIVNFKMTVECLWKSSFIKRKYFYFYTYFYSSFFHSVHRYQRSDVSPLQQGAPLPEPKGPVYQLHLPRREPRTHMAAGNFLLCAYGRSNKNIIGKFKAKTCFLFKASRLHPQSLMCWSNFELLRTEWIIYNGILQKINRTICNML